jgi:hypothetical protein
MERTKLITEFTFVATFIAATLVSTLALISDLFPSSAFTGFNGFLLRTLTATGTYLLLFKIAIWIYFKVLWKFFNRSTLIDGNWRYSFNDSYDSNTKQYTEPDRFGEARIIHNADEINVFAESKDASVNPSKLLAIWNSVSVLITGQRVDLSINLTGITYGAGGGFAVLHIVTQKPWLKIIPKLPKKMEGHYFIVTSETRSVRSGRIVFERIE